MSDQTNAVKIMSKEEIKARQEALGRIIKSYIDTGHTQKVECSENGTEEIFNITFEHQDFNEKLIIRVVHFRGESRLAMIKLGNRYVDFSERISQYRIFTSDDLVEIIGKLNDIVFRARSTNELDILLKSFNL